MPLPFSREKDLDSELSMSVDLQHKKNVEYHSINVKMGCVCKVRQGTLFIYADVYCVCLH